MTPNKYADYRYELATAHKPLTLSHQGLVTLEDPFTSELHVESSQKEREGGRETKKDNEFSARAL